MQHNGDRKEMIRRKLPNGIDGTIKVAQLPCVAKRMMDKAGQYWAGHCSENQDRAVAWGPPSKRPNKARSFVVVLSDDQNSELLVEDGGFERTVATKYRIPYTQTDDVKETLNKKGQWAAWSLELALQVFMSDPLQ
jgi:hypothetical protein